MTTTMTGASTLSQVAAVAALSDSSKEYLRDWVLHLQDIRDTATAMIKEHSYGLASCIAPEATYVLWINISRTGFCAEEIAKRLLDKYKVAVVPGIEAIFGPGARGHIRLSMGTSKSMFMEGVRRLCCCLKDIAATKPVTLTGR